MFKTKKIVAILMLITILFSFLSNLVYAATPISEAYLEDRGEAEWHLQFWNEKQNGWYYVTATYVAYTENGHEYPAYCINRLSPGVRRI